MDSFIKHGLRGIYNRFRMIDDMIDYGTKKKDDVGIVVLSGEKMIKDTNDAVIEKTEKLVKELNERKFNDSKGKTIKLVRYESGQYFKGDYAHRGLIFNNESLSVKVSGCSVEELIALAEEISEIAGRRGAIVGLYGKNEIYVKGF